MHISFKLTFRSWRRNKVFAVISILSLAIGIACTNLLTAFVVYESNIETDNPNIERIWYMTQDSPMQSGETISYISGSVAQQIKDAYPAVEDYLRLSTENMNYVGVGDKRFPPIICLTADASFPVFFPYEVLYGDLNRALTEPDKIALTEQTATLFFGDENALGKLISFIPDSDYGFYADEVPKETTYEIVAVVKNREQSFLRFDAVTSNTGNFHGGVTFVLANQSVMTDEFAKQLKKDGIRTMQGDGRYYFASLQDSYFRNYPQTHHLNYINGQQKNLLYVGFIAAFLILLISCFNYINLNFSRLVQQIRTIRIQRLMGAENSQITLQLFGDTFLTVFIAFLLSLLIAYDILPLFNNIVGGRIRPAFFFNLQVLPYLCLFILTLSAVPALYIGRKVAKQTQQDYKAFFIGNNRQRVIATLTIAQFTISIALLIGTITANRQIGLISKGGESYKGLIEIGSYMKDNSYIRPMVNELKAQLKIEDIAVSGSSILFSGMSQIIIKDDNGSETYCSLLQYVGNPGFIKTLGVSIRQGLPPEEAMERYARPVYINERFARILVPENENPVGMPLNTYTTSYRKASDEIIIAGIIDNFYTNSLESEIFPAFVQLDNDESSLYYIYLRLDAKQPEMLETIQAIWEKYNPNKAFPYHNVWEMFKIRNKRIYEMSHLLMMFSLISIFLTCFGLFGMALYATEQRTKEIGIRKVNGATTLQIMLMLNRQFVLWVAIAFLIAAPVTWLLLNRWLENFAYRVNVTAGICLLAVLIVLVVTLITVSWHSYKAAKANPVDSLRDE